MELNFHKIEQKWQQKWADEKIYKTEIDPLKPKYYVLDMFPYPSGAGLHVGHPLGYIASDIVSRYKRLKGFNVLHPMGFDAFGLPAEQYAIQTGQHPADSTAQNITRYKEQLNNIGFSYDWDREVMTSDPQYYKWTQWIFLQLFDCWFDNETGKAAEISDLRTKFKEGGSKAANAAHGEHAEFSADKWNAMGERQQREILMQYRLAYQDFSAVNWCEALGTVLANDEVKDGLSERGGHPVEKRKMRQWFLRITAYAERLINDLDSLEWTDSMKEMQRNWIGRSEGAMVKFQLENSEDFIEVFTTRPDTIFGVDFLTLAPEHQLVTKITTVDKKQSVEEYVNVAKNRSERERMADVKRVSGAFTGAYAIHPFTGGKIPVWVGDYVLAGYGTGAVMAVPAGDQRDWDFARHFDISITAINDGIDISEAANPTKEARMINSGFLNGLTGYEAIKKAIKEIEAKAIGSGKINYRLRDAGFSRQRYWGEPFPIVYKDGIAYPLPVDKLPIELPVMQDFKPTGKPESPLAKNTDWVNSHDGIRETDTMPGYAGSSWYFLRYMDAKNKSEFLGKEAENYWQDVDLYIGGTEHAVGHLLYARFWQKFLFDRGQVSKIEPFKKLVNQGMILGMSEKIYSRKGVTDNSFGINPPDLFSDEIHFGNSFFKFYISADIIPTDKANKEECIGDHPENVPIEFVKNNRVNLNKLIAERPQQYRDCIFVCNEGFWKNGKFLGTNYLNNKYPGQHSIILPSNEDWENAEDGLGTFTSISEVEKMSKSKANVVNPDDIISEYGADTLRLYEMFLGPLEQSKPWNTNGIEGVHRFLRKLWNLFYNTEGNLQLTDDVATEKELRILHKTIRKSEEDIERFSFNTSVSGFMICVNELAELKCRKRSVLKDLLVILSPYAPHIAEELWQAAGETVSITKAAFPNWNEDFIKESSVAYPVAFNGKVRYQILVPADMPQNEVQETALSHEEFAKWTNGTPKKVIVVPGRMVNVVV